MATFKHNKRRDSGLVYEFLVRHLSKAMVNGDRHNYQKCLEIVRKYYGDGTALAEERELFDVIKNTRGVTEQAARRILSEVQRAARALDSKKIDIKKSNLIKEINYTFGKGFFTQYRIPEYRLLASIQMMINASQKENRLTESVQKIQLEEGLVKYMTTKGTFSESMTQKSEVDQLVMAMVAKRFNEKYSKSLSSPQKVLLEKYIRAQVTSDEKPLNDFMLEESKRINIVLKMARDMKEFSDDGIMKERLEQAEKTFSTMRLNGANEKTVEEMMLFQRLAEEVQSND